MNDGKFSALSTISLTPGSMCPQPIEPPDSVHFDDPASSVMTDFNISLPITTGAGVSIDDALEHMKTSGVRLLLVVDQEQCVIGLITAKDILGERPIKLAQESRIPHADITVSQIMTLQSAIVALPIATVNDARVGHIVETLNQLERQHILVVEEGDGTSRHRVRGLFSISQISKQLHQEVIHHLGAAHSLAEIVREIK